MASLNLKIQIAFEVTKQTVVLWNFIVLMDLDMVCHDIQGNDTQHNDFQHKDTQHNNF
jgi:hypothetical protein